MRRAFGSWRRDEGGQTVVLVALAMSVLLLGVGLAIDTGALYVVRRDAQAAADAAAWAGAVELHAGGTAAAAVTAARDDASANGYTHGGLTSVTAASPPASGEFAGDVRYIEVRITREVATVFLSGATSGRTLVAAGAVGGAAPVGTGKAILTLGDVPQAFKISGNGNLNISGGDVQVNSSHPSAAAQLSGSGSVIVTAPNVTKVVGGVQESGSGEFTPAAETGAASVPDPFRALPEPTATIPVFNNTQFSDDAPHTLSPGVYNNGIKISGNGVITMEPGTYILAGGGFQLSGNGTLTGAGVTIFNTVSGHPGSTGSCDQVQISGNGAVALSAPTSGLYKGMLLWQDEDCDKKVQWSGNGALTSGSGTIYTPNAEFGISGNGEAALGISSQIISKTFSISGNAAIELTYDAALTAKPLSPSLVD